MWLTTTGLTLTGTLTASVKPFLINHPSPGKSGQKLRHWAVESSDSPGGMVLYRRTLDMTASTATLELPSYFQHLAKDAMVMCTPYQHFGSAWGEVDGNTVTIHATTLGMWHILVTASRQDAAAEQCEREIEFTPAP